ncbi:hypothetical protein Rt10032_c10g4147 [Rhodotorula toruloides]|uniref:Uncharacterized protein n=1 Tax=Rhodotorula toruloides TaxID=5286 RepID=A0A511KIC5_RHOTO|nr:hypothetical protein Rt10032_c10g4147 [Rhodotorula toruloides]
MIRTRFEKTSSTIGDKLLQQAQQATKKNDTGNTYKVASSAGQGVLQRTRDQCAALLLSRSRPYECVRFLALSLQGMEGDDKEKEGLEE